MNNSLSKGLRAIVIATAAMLGLAAIGVTTVEAHPRTRIGVWVGGPFWWGPGPYYGYGGYPYPYVVERPVIVQAPAEPMVVPPSAAQQANTWYYCRDSQMYYPHVSTCASPWQEVPAAPAANSAPTPAPAAAPATAPAPVPSSSTTRVGTPVPTR
jgi:hypothetical protein